MKKICFFANHILTKNHYKTSDYYTNDIKIFKELGYEVVICESAKQIPDDVDLYFIWWWSSGIIALRHAKKFKKPTIMIGNLHYTDPSTQGYFARPFYIRTMIKYCLRNSDLQIATSKIEFEGIKTLKAKNPIYLYHCIDETKYSHNGLNRQNYLFTVTHLTEVNVERKKVKEIIKAFNLIKNEFPDLKLKIAGGTDDKGYLGVKQIVDNLNINDRVEFLGRIPDSEKIEHYKNCKIYVQPTDFEGFGMAIAESMLCGAPVVTSPNGAVPEVTGDLAVMVDANNVDEIAAGIRKLMQDEGLYKKLNSEGPKRVKELFSYNVRKEKIKGILEKFI